MAALIRCYAAQQEVKNCVTINHSGCARLDYKSPDQYKAEMAMLGKVA